MKKSIFTKTHLIIATLCIAIVYAITGLALMSNSKIVKAEGDPINLGYGYESSAALTIAWGNDINLFFCTQNGIGTTDWTQFNADSTDAITLTRGDTTYNVGNSSEAIWWYGSYWRVETWKFNDVTANVFPVVNGDIITFNGTFTSSDSTKQVKFDNIQVTFHCNGADPSSSTENYVTVKNGNAVQLGYGYSRDQVANYNNDEGKITGIYFKLDENTTAPYNSDWSVEYKPIRTSAIKLVRNGETHNVGQVDHGTLIKFGSSAMYLKIDGWAFDSSYIPLLAGDQIIIEGEFYYTDSSSVTTVINMSKTIIQIDDSSETVSNQTKAWVYGENVTASKTIRGTNIYKDWAGAAYYYFGADLSTLPSNLSPLTPDCIKLTRGDTTYNVGAYWASDALQGNGGDSYLVKKEYFNYFVSGLSTTQEGDIITIEGKFVYTSDDGTIEVVEIEKTVIVISADPVKGSGYYYSEVLPTHYATVTSMDCDITTTWRPFMNVVVGKMDDENDIPVNSDWSVVYKPTKATNIIYNAGTEGAQDQAVGKIGAQAFNALSLTQFVLRIDSDGQGIADDAPVGAKVIINGYFICSASVDGYGAYDTAAIYFDNLVLYKVGSNKNDWAQVYDLTYELNGGSVEVTNPSTYNVIYGAAIAAPAKTGYGLEGWYTTSTFDAETKVDTLVGKTGDVKLYANYSPVNYTITYNNVDGVTNPNATSYTIESSTITLQDVSKDYYTFDGWYLDSEFTTKVTEITTGSTGDKVIYAKFTAVEYTATVEYGYKDAKDEVKFTVENKADKLTEVSALKPEADAEYTYSWAQALPAELPLENVTYTVNRTAVEYTATIAYGYKDAKDEVKFTVENRDVKLAEIANFLPSNDTEYTYSWAEVLPAELTLENVTYTINKVAIEYTAAVTYGYKNTKDEITFTVENKADKLTKVSELKPTDDDEYTYAWAEALPKELPLENVAYVVNRTAVEYTAAVTYGYKNTKDEITFTVENKANKLAEISALKPQDDAQYTYAWAEALPNELPLDDVAYVVNRTVNTYTVTFDLNGGTGEASTQTVEYGSKVTKPADPTKAKTAQYSYTFDGWFVGTSNWDFENNEVTSNITIVAKYLDTINNYTLTVNVEGVSEQGKIFHYDYGTKVTSATFDNEFNKDGYTYVVKDSTGAEITELTISADTTVTVIYTANKTESTGCGSSISTTTTISMLLIALIGAFMVIARRRVNN